MGTPQGLNSEIDVEALLELKYLLINGTGRAQLGLMVQGVARVPQEGSVYGTVLHIVTAAGTITLDGTIVTFSTTIANIFAEAGFRVSSTRRALLGSYAVLGFFNTVKGFGSLETTYAYGGYIRVMYDFALHPFWRKIEVLADNSTAVSQWQENVWPEGSTNEVKTYFCRSYEKASTGIAGFNASSVISYTYGGIDAIGDTLARRFELVVSQPSRKDGKSEALRIDYWDSPDGNMPLKFEFQHPDIGE
ncbi:hypothetical protein GPECTOR_27g640 [Gonium pectorale]|uniref:Uncharacterized protein n=1 Tax=Gonium pectorale TaxID=33097 RepID=A0A150GGK0_GONPE|nr:hypothetical protein GPECTOR_27g640 [Gonium pectorale]|eukprot:KXZ48470.1 hypothetical protein GPECTOR_27g640 [Gonium pectorale]